MESFEDLIKIVQNMPRGVVELTRSYQRHLKIGFRYSVLLHVLVVGVYWGTVVVDPPKTTSSIVRIQKYDELVPLGISNSDLGLKARPIMISEQLPGSDRPSKAIATRQAVTKKPNAFPRSMGRGIGDLPSITPNDKINANSLAAVTPDMQHDRNDAVGGGNRDYPNDIRGGNPVPAGSGDSPAGTAISGVGSASKPAPGIYGTGGNGGSDFSGDGAGGGIGYSTQWLGGGVRKKIAGDLPKYPDNAKVEAEIKLLAVVGPDGTIGMLTPVVKGNTYLEEAAIREVRLWRFEPLRSSQQQVDQNCMITFLFRLK